MSALSLIEFLSSLTSIEPALNQQLTALVKPERYNYRQVFHVAGQVENRLWYMEEGLVRAYYFDYAGKEHTLQFFKPRDIIFSWHGVYREPADFYLEALEASALLSLDYQDLDTLLAKYPEARLLANIFLRRRFHQDTYYSRMLTWTAEERYRQLRNLDPELFRRVSIRLIATYLNMTRENLSRLITGDV